MVCVCLHALLATTAQPAKLAIYWKGENVATNGTAAAAVRSRGFTHAVVAHLDSAAALVAASLAPILLLGEQPYAPRAHSPYLDAAAFDASVATLRAALRNRTAALAGVAEDLELHPFPQTTYDADGGATAFNYTDLGERLGLAPRAAADWPTFTDWPAAGAHPPLTMDAVQFNGATAAVARPRTTAAVALPAEGVALAQPFRAPPRGVTRIDLPAWRVPAAAVDGPIPPGYPSAALDYFVCGATADGAPDPSAVVACGGCQIQPKELPLNASAATALYIDPEEASLAANATYFLVVRWSGAAAAHDAQQYAIGVDGVDGGGGGGGGALWVLAAHGGSWARDAEGRAVPLATHAPVPPPGFSPSELHRDFIRFQCAVNAKYIATYRAAAAAEQLVAVYSGYSGHLYKPTTQNFPSDVAAAYSTDWDALAAAGLSAAVVGYGEVDVTATRAALGGRAALVCGARKDQTTFAERFATCDGAMEWYPGGFSADPGFYVPSAVNRRGGV